MPIYSVILLSMVFCAPYFQVMGQALVGIDICGCQPAVYEITLDFSISCEDGTITDATDGITDSSCLVASTNEQTTASSDLSFVRVSTIEILELKDFNPIAQTQYIDGYTTGSQIMYTSILATLQTDNVDSSRIPNGIQFNLNGENSLGQFISEQVIITFDNDCGVFPLLFVQDQIGSIRFVSQICTRETESPILLVIFSPDFFFVDRPRPSTNRGLPCHPGDVFAIYGYFKPTNSL